MAEATVARLDYDHRAAGYARYRTVNPQVVQALVESGRFGADAHVLDVGCGTGNYAAALTALTGCRMTGIDPSAQMLERAQLAARWESLVQGRAEQLPFPDDVFDVVMSTDVIHHMSDRETYFREAARVLRPGGQVITVTDSHDDIPRRRPLSSHFPETVAVELRRYSTVPRLLDEMKQADFVDPRVEQVSHAYDLDNIEAFRARTYSSLLLIDEAAFVRGITRLEADLARGPISALSLYTILWGTAPLA